MSLTLKEQRIKDDLIDVSKKLFQLFGFVKTTMEDIAKTARKSKSTLYRFFKNKEEVLHGVITKEIYELHYVVVKESSKGRNSAEKLRLYLKTILTETKKKLLIYSLIKGELDVIPFNTAIVKKKLDTLDMEEVTGILRNGIILKEFSSSYYEYVSSIAYYLVNATRGLMLQLVFSDDLSNVDNDNNFDVFIDILLKGLES
jgi:AcrR family transcriptional regulator